MRIFLVGYNMLRKNVYTFELYRLKPSKHSYYYMFKCGMSRLETNIIITTNSCVHVLVYISHVLEGLRKGLDVNRTIKVK